MGIRTAAGHPERPEKTRFGIRKCGSLTLHVTAVGTLGGTVVYAGRIWHAGYELVHAAGATVEEAEERAKQLLQETWPEAEWALLGYEWN